MWASTCGCARARVNLEATRAAGVKSWWNSEAMKSLPSVRGKLKESKEEVQEGKVRQKSLIASSYRRHTKGSPHSMWKKTCVCLCDFTVGSLTSFLCVSMFVSLCNYAHSSAHSSDSCRFCQVDIQKLAVNNSRFVWPARSSTRWWGGHLNLTREGRGGEGGALGVWAPVCTIWQGVRRGCIIRGGDHLQKTVEAFNLDALV